MSVKEFDTRGFMARAMSDLTRCLENFRRAQYMLKIPWLIAKFAFASGLQSCFSCAPPISHVQQGFGMCCNSRRPFSVFGILLKNEGVGSHRRRHGKKLCMIYVTIMMYQGWGFCGAAHIPCLCRGSRALPSWHDGILSFP